MGGGFYFELERTPEEVAVSGYTGEFGGVALM